jgi:hypothetical protein
MDVVGAAALLVFVASLAVPDTRLKPSPVAQRVAPHPWHGRVSTARPAVGLDRRWRAGEAGLGV